MKRIALVLAATALVGTACDGGERTCARSVTLEWDSRFTTADGATVGCSSANGDIRFVDVFVNDGFAGSFDCGAARGTVAVPRGSSLVTVEGVDAAGAIVYRDEFFWDATVCGNQFRLTQPAEGRVSVEYSFSPVNACFPDAQSFIWVTVRDDIANVIAADSAAAPELWACGDEVSFRLAAGNYTLLDAREMIRSDTGHSTVAKDCTDRPLTVSAARTTPVAPVLFDSTTGCP